MTSNTLETTIAIIINLALYGYVARCAWRVVRGVPRFPRAFRQWLAEWSDVHASWTAFRQGRRAIKALHTVDQLLSTPNDLGFANRDEARSLVKSLRVRVEAYRHRERLESERKIEARRVERASAKREARQRLLNLLRLRRTGR